MAKPEDLALFETANSALAFREQAYTRADAAQFLKDILALANAEVDVPRYLFVGVRDVIDEKRTFPGIDAAAMDGMRKMLPAVLAHCVEPRFKIALRPLKIRGSVVALFLFGECANPPYLLRRKVAGLPAGLGWLRRGAKVAPLTRADLQRLFMRSHPTTAATADVRVAFAGDSPRDELELAVLDLPELPSAVAANRIKQLLEGKEHVKDMLGEAETRMNRLLHAQIFGIEQPYEAHSEASLRLQIGNVGDEHAAADRYYEQVVRAHKLELVASNRGGTALDDVTLRLQLRHLRGIGISERLYSPTGLDAGTGTGYPVVTIGKRVTEIEASIDELPPGATVAIFREPPRLWVREPAAGKSIAVDYSVHARGLDEPIRDSLLLRFAPAAAAGRPPKRSRTRLRA